MSQFELNLPWTIKDQSVVDDSGRSVEANGFSSVLSHSQWQIDARALAAFIVTAVNSHHALIEAAEQALGYLKALSAENGHASEALRSALSLARRQS